MIRYVLSVALALMLMATASAQECTERVRVAIDIGHDLRSSGAVGASGTSEYAYNARLAREVLALLNATNWIDAFLVEEHGAQIRLSERTKRARARRADILVSLHHDSAQEQFLDKRVVNGKTLFHTELFEGFSIFYSQKNPHPQTSKRIAQAIGSHMRQAGMVATDHHAMDVDGERRDLVDPENGVYRFDDLVVLKGSIPAVLVESGVIVNPQEEQRLNNPQYRKLIADSILRGLYGMRCELSGLGSGARG